MTDRTPNSDAKNARTVLMHWLLSIDIQTRTQGKVLVCRPSADHPWEPCGFVADTKKQTMNFKLGNFDPTASDKQQRHYQPIGRDNGDEFFPDSAAKLLWRYQFGLASIETIGTPFAVEEASEETKAALPKDMQKDDFLMSEDQLKDLNKVFVDIQTVLMKHCELEKTYAKIEDKDLDPMQKIELTELIETIKWHALNCKLLSDAIANINKQIPEGQERIKPDFSNIQPKKFAEALLNYIRMWLEEDAMRRTVVSTQVATTKVASVEELVISGIVAVTDLIKDGEAGLVLTQTPEQTEQVLFNLSRVYPGVMNAMTPFNGKDVSVEEVQAVRAALAVELESINAQKAAALSAKLGAEVTMTTEVVDSPKREATQADADAAAAVSSALPANFDVPPIEGSEVKLTTAPVENVKPGDGTLPSDQPAPPTAGA